MTFSEFGRRASENGNKGTDHGTAAPLFVMGSQLKAGLHGTALLLELAQKPGRQLSAPISVRFMPPCSIAG